MPIQPPCRLAGQHGRAGRVWVTHGARPSLPGALAVSGTGKTPPELRTPSGASSPGMESEKELMMPHLPASTR